MGVIEINHLTLSNGFYLFSVVGAGLVDFFPFWYHPGAFLLFERRGDTFLDRLFALLPRTSQLSFLLFGQRIVVTNIHLRGVAKSCAGPHPLRRDVQRRLIFGVNNR